MFLSIAHQQNGFHLTPLSCTLKRTIGFAYYAALNKNVIMCAAPLISLSCMVTVDE